jgi:hypothetical protein
MPLTTQQQAWIRAQARHRGVTLGVRYEGKKMIVEEIPKPDGSHSVAGYAWHTEQ